jgi:hypothetical protein
MKSRATDLYYSNEYSQSKMCVRHIKYSTLGSAGVNFSIDELLQAHHTYKDLKHLKHVIRIILFRGTGTLFL